MQEGLLQNMCLMSIWGTGLQINNPTTLLRQVLRIMALDIPKAEGLGGDSRGRLVKIAGERQKGKEEKYVQKCTTGFFLQMVMMKAVTNGQCEQLFLI